MHHFFTTGFFTFLGLVRDLVHTSFGTSVQLSRAFKAGTSLVTCLHCLCGSRVHCSSGFSPGIVRSSVRHSWGPARTPHPEGPHSSTGTFWHRVSGVNFFTGVLCTLHTSLGHLLHLVLVVYPEVSSSHFSSTTVSQDT